MAHPATDHLLSMFEYEHLPVDLAQVSQPFSALAHRLAVELGDGPELTVGLRKLLESKDAMVRHAVLSRSGKG
ncbi:hypothetical protein SEA_DELRIO_12 [Gordonia phage DelRio]|nr:hypothetical protein SEA_DELRIO_12 [Gordonia phage DelRio]